MPLEQLDLVVLALAALALLLLGWRLRRFWSAVRLGRNRRRGASAERLAERLLAAAGYTIVAGQQTMTGTLLVDGEPLEFDVRADAIVERDGRRLVAEVKSGEVAVLTHRATRRQLLEYAWVFRLDGVLLVDTAERRIRRVDFPRLLGP